MYPLSMDSLNEPRIGAPRIGNAYPEPARSSPWNSGNKPPAPERGNLDSGDSSVAGDGGGQGKVHEISATSLQDMRRVSISLGCATNWLRVVHSGYGQDAWQLALQEHGLTVLQAQSPAEGAYVRVPDDKSAEDMVLFLTEINRNVRRRTRFRDMNRANKSRLQFKCEPFLVAPELDQIPELVRTSRFVANSLQWHSGSGASSGTSGEGFSGNQHG